jgi:hypothetical protein
VADTNFIPPGLLTLKSAVDLTGQHCFGFAWTGREIRQLRDPPPKRPSQRLESAVNQLRGLLALERVSAIAIAENGKQFSVPAALWRSEDGRRAFDIGLLSIGGLPKVFQARKDQTLLRRIHVPEDQLQTALAEDIEKRGTLVRQATAASETKCRKWLLTLMNKASPTKPKAEYLADAKEKFGVGTRAFLRAWDQAVIETGKTEWSKPGRKS